MSESTEPQVVELDSTTVAALRETVPMTGLREYYDRAFHTIMGVIQGQGIQPTGPPVGIYYSMPTETVDMAAGFPTDREVTADAGVEATTLPARQSGAADARGFLRLDGAVLRPPHGLRA